jgi:hypothetical protein
VTAPLPLKTRFFITVSTRIAIRSVAVLVVMAALAAPALANLGSLRALGAPIIHSPGGKSHADSYLLKGEVDSIRTDSWVHILRNGIEIDSVSAARDTLFARRVPLLVGDNSFRTFLTWRTSQSPGSNIVTVHFDTAAGFFIPVPMLPGDSFDLNPVQPATRVDVRIFDPAGDLVIKFESRETKDFYSFVWDGKNGSFQSVRRGLLVAVGALDYPDGTHEVVRKAFLFDPEGTR